MNELDAPSNIHAALNRLLVSGEKVSFLLKSLLKPSATIPYVWFAITDRRCVLFSTLRGGSVFKEARFAAINSAQISRGDEIIVLMKDPSGDWRVQIDPKYREGLQECVGAVNSRLHSSG
jgi:hypothetical protein